MLCCNAHGFLSHPLLLYLASRKSQIASRRQKKLSGVVTRKCWVCYKPLDAVAPDKVFRHHDTLHLRRRHHGTSVRKAVQRQGENSAQPLTVEQIAAIIVTTHWELREAREEKQKRCNQYSMRVNKQRLRARKPG